MKFITIQCHVTYKQFSKMSKTCRVIVEKHPNIPKPNNKIVRVVLNSGLQYDVYISS